MEPIAITGLLLRRAVLGTLLAAGRPLTTRQVADALRSAGATTSGRLTKGPSRVIADLLAHQARLGNVRKVAPATFEVVPTSMSRSTRRRCLRWRDQLAAFAPDLPGDHSCAGSPSSDASVASDEGEQNSTGDGPLGSAEPLQRRRTNW